MLEIDKWISLLCSQSYGENIYSFTMMCDVSFEFFFVISFIGLERFSSLLKVCFFFIMSGCCIFEMLFLYQLKVIICGLCFYFINVVNYISWLQILILLWTLRINSRWKWYITINLTFCWGFFPFEVYEGNIYVIFFSWAVFVG